MKVGKDELTGLLGAVEFFLDDSDENDYRRWRRRRVDRRGGWRGSTACTPRSTTQTSSPSLEACPTSAWNSWA